MTTYEERVKILQAEVDRNFEAFKKQLPDLLKTSAGKYALLRDQQVIEVFDSASDAQKYALAQYPDGRCSIQHISDHIADLGYFSHVMHVG